MPGSLLVPQQATDAIRPAYGVHSSGSGVHVTSSGRNVFAASRHARVQESSEDSSSGSSEDEAPARPSTESKESPSRCIFRPNKARISYVAQKQRGTKEDPLGPLIRFVGCLQENAIPLIVGVITALVLANVCPEQYNYYFGEGIPVGLPEGHGHDAAPGHVELLPNTTGMTLEDGLGNSTRDVAALEGPEGVHNMTVDASGDVEELQRYVLWDCPIYGRDVTFHFIANDIVMVFFFGLAAKEVTEAMLPGGSLNPPLKAANPILATLGGVLGPVFSYFLILEVFYYLGFFAEYYTLAELFRGWGIVTATDIALAWMVAKLVFGSGHPATDYLLLLAVADDAIGLIIIAVFYPDPQHPTKPEWLLLVVAAMLVAYLLRRWHFRIERVSHQSWVPYVLMGGLLSWTGLVKANLHPALALVPIVPFMPGPREDKLARLNDAVTDEITRHVSRRLATRLEATGCHDADDTVGRQESGQSDMSLANVIDRHASFARGRGHEIAAGLYAGSMGRTVEPSLKHMQFDLDGNAHACASTLDDFEHTVKIYVDFGLFLFALCGAGIHVEGFGAMTWLIFLSLLLGKFFGIWGAASLARQLGFPAPLGVRASHIRMVGLIGGIGLTVALFVSDAAFVEEQLQAASKLGAVLSGLIGLLAVAIGRCVGFSTEDVLEEAVEQLREEIEEEERIAAAATESEDTEESDDDNGTVGRRPLSSTFEGKRINSRRNVSLLAL
eukprot:TRINITY_DN15186_c0_g1_i1.p1 TRINITY_DN15186_c0_g1~~TRINITY_DN15186_c0_g1_i1.p1  ORF type:complete len:727 (-),score=135.72 TRINITY_DN15186_c0_g1_i1:48-2228(-)